jgi:hypothetical protein
MRTGWLGALGDLVGVGASVRSAPSAPGAPSAPPTNLAQPQHGFSAANPGPAWATWDSYPTYVQTQAQPTNPYTSACGQWSAPLKKGELDGFLYSTAVMMVEAANGQPVTQQTRQGLFLFALEDEMVTVRKCLSQNVPVQQAKFSALAGAPVIGVGDCGPGCNSCPFCKQPTNPFGGVVVGVSGCPCGNAHPAVCLPDPPAFRTGEPCGGAPVPARYLRDQGRDAAFTGVGASVRVAPGASLPLPGPTPSTAGGQTGPAPQWSFQHAVQPGQTPGGHVTPLTYVDIAQQMPLRPPGKMAYQPTLPWWTAWHKHEQHAFNCWWANQQFAQPVCGLGAVANMPATPDFASLAWAIQMGIPFASEIQCGLAAGPVSKPVGGKPLEALAVLATALGVSVATLLAMKAVRR